MPLPRPELVIWFLGAFITGWAASLIWRGLSARIVRGRRSCPACMSEMPPSMGLVCAACLNTAQSETDLFRRRISRKHVLPGAFLVLVGLGIFLMGFYVEEWIWGGGRAMVRGTSPWQGAGLGLAAFALTLGIWGLRGDPARGRRRCRKCWYEIRVAGLTCSECGHAARNETEFYCTRRRPATAVVAMLLLLLAGSALLVPRVQRGGWVGLIPTTVMIAGVRSLPTPVIGPGVPFVGRVGLQDKTLSGRVASGDLWEWQLRWLNGRTADILLTSDDTQLVVRAGALVQALDAKQAERATDIAADLLAGADPEAIARGVVLLSMAVNSGHEAGTKLVAPHAAVIAGALSDPRLQVQGAAAQLMGHAGAAGASLIPRMLKAAGTPSPWSSPISWVIQYSLSRILERSPDGSMVLLSAVDDPDPAVATAAVIAIATIRNWGGVAPSLATTLSRSIEHPDPSVPQAAIRMISWRALGDQMAAEQLSALIDKMLTQVRNRTTRREVFVPQGATFGRSLLPRLADLGQLLSDSDPAVSGAAATSIYDLVQIDPLACRAMLEPLEAVRNQPDPSISYVIENTLRAIKVGVAQSQGPDPDAAPTGDALPDGTPENPR